MTTHLSPLENHSTVAIRPTLRTRSKTSSIAVQHPSIGALIIATALPARLTGLPASPCRSGGFSRARSSTRPSG
jgi:hypothetical protein